MMRRETFEVKIGNITIGSGHPIAIQSMLCASLSDHDANVQQAKELYAAGCDIIRVAITKEQDVPLIQKLKEATPMPVVADIQFDYKMALAAADAGADKIRINPGNLTEERVKIVVDKCQELKLPIRIGINSGSLNKKNLQQYGRPTAEALFESAMENIELLEKNDFHNYVVAIKSSDVFTTVNAYRMLATHSKCPIHLGVTEAGTERTGLIKSSAAFGALLADGIGDTIRVSLTANPVREVIAAKDILKSLNLSNHGIRIVSCPTCGRCRVNIIELAEKLEMETANCDKNLKVAVMGCAVNGPGEARDADLGLAGGNGDLLLFSKGEIIRKVSKEEAIPVLLKMINEY